MLFTEVEKMGRTKLEGWQVSQEENQNFRFCMCLRWILGITPLGPLLSKLNFMPVSIPFSRYLLRG